MELDLYIGRSAWEHADEVMETGFEIRTSFGHNNNLENKFCTDGIT